MASQYRGRQSRRISCVLDFQGRDRCTSTPELQPTTLYSQIHHTGSLAEGLSMFRPREVPPGVGRTPHYSCRKTTTRSDSGGSVVEGHVPPSSCTGRLPVAAGTARGPGEGHSYPRSSPPHAPLWVVVGPATDTRLRGPSRLVSDRGGLWEGSQHPSVPPVSESPPVRTDYVNRWTMDLHRGSRRVAGVGRCGRRRVTEVSYPGTASQGCDSPSATYPSFLATSVYRHPFRHPKN